ncbi:MAG: DUF4258 domain-containing protein [Bacillota bacterium]
MKRMVSLLLIIALSLGSVIGVYAQSPILETMQKQSSQQTLDKVFSYIMSLPIESRKELINDPYDFIKNDKKLSKLVAGLSVKERKEFYAAFEPNVYEKEDKSKNSYIKTQSVGDTWEKWKQKFMGLVAWWLTRNYVFTKHVIDQAVKRGISPETASKALEKGKHYTDLRSGARIVWDKARDIAFVIASDSNDVITIYNKVSQSKSFRWAVDNWKW